MRKMITLAASALTLLLFGGNAFAEDPPPPTTKPAADSSGGGEAKKIGLGLDAQFLLPVGDWADASGPHVGPILRFGYRVMPPLEVTVRAGYLLDFGKSAGGATLKSNILPVHAGARYFFMDPSAGLYGAGEIGMNMIMPSMSPEVPGVTLKNQTRFGLNLGVGYVISKDLPIDIRGQFSYLNLLGTETGEKGAFGVGLSVGYTLQM